MKTKRQIIKIDEELCNGCGACIDGCHEGVLQLIEGKARIVSELYCDGLGACIGECPVGAITIEEREAEPYDEIAVMERISTQGDATTLTHLKHLKDHGETECAKQPLVSQLAQWPVQLHLLNPLAGCFRGADVVLAADCTAYAYADFHNRFIRNHTLAIACPKLDSNKEEYVKKIIDMIDSAEINTLTVIIMEVPCCRGLAQLASEQAQRKVPVKVVTIGVNGMEKLSMVKG